MNLVKRYSIRLLLMIAVAGIFLLSPQISGLVETLGPFWPFADPRLPPQPPF